MKLLAASLALVSALTIVVQVEEVDVFSGLVGTWKGELRYLDDSSEEEVALPASLDARLSKGGAYLITELEFRDPSYSVRSFDVSSFDSDSMTLLTHAFSNGVVEREELIGELQAGSTSKAWTLVFHSEGVDNERPAEFRLTRSLDGDRFTAKKEVRYRGDSESTWSVRNLLSLERALDVPDPRALLGTWRVDLRPTPDADPYYATLQVTSAGDETLEGRFYDTPISEARVNVDWGAVHFAFVTEDGSGTYHTTGRVLPDGTLSGTTHSIGRDFLSVWTADVGL